MQSDKNMKKFILVLTVFVMVLLSYETIHSLPTGAPAGASGGPAENLLTCYQSGCHFGIPAVVTNYFTTDIPAAGYTPKRTYKITVSFTGSGNKGFQFSAQDSVGHYLGNMISGTGSQITGTNYVTHTSPKSASTATWTFQWTAPARGKPRFSLYGAFAIGQSVTKKQNIRITENKQLPLVTTLPASPVSNSAATMNASANAKNGGYTVSFQYKPEGGSWTFANATTTDITGDTVNFVKISLAGLQPGTKYIYRACAWNPGDTTWSDTLTFTTSLSAGVRNEQNIDVLSVYPQPATTFTKVRFYLAHPEPVQIHLFNLNGEKVSTQPYPDVTTGKNELELPLNLPKGIYIMHLQAGPESRIQKILVD